MPLSISLVAVACGGSGAASVESTTARALSGETREGIATFYDADGSGNCSFDPSASDVTALAMTAYAESASCGACLRVMGPRGEVTVRVVDSCPSCADSGIDLDLGAQAFAKIADPEEGRVPVTYELVACGASGNIAFHFKDGSSKYWTAIQIRNHNVPVATLEYARGGAFVPMRRESYNYFVEPRGVGDQPTGLLLRVTSHDGQVIEETLPGAIPSNETIAGSQQFQ